MSDNHLEKKEELINKEVCRLSDIYVDIEDKRKRTIEGLIQRAAFLRVTLAELEEDINANGVKERAQEKLANAEQWARDRLREEEREANREFRRQEREAAAQLQKTASSAISGAVKAVTGAVQSITNVITNNNSATINTGASMLTSGQVSRAVEKAIEKMGR